MKPSGQTRLPEQAYHEAVNILRACARPGGMRASAQVPGYPQVWARDSMITLLGAVLLGDRAIDASIEASIKLLSKHQTPLGLIPNNVHADRKEPNFQAYADAGLWLVVGIANFARQTGKRAILKRYYPAARKTLEWYEYQDVDRTGLITVEEGADWEDLFAVRGKGLYVNVLYYLALRKAASMAGERGDHAFQKHCSKRGSVLKRAINRYFWYRGADDDLKRHLEPSLGAEHFNEEGVDSLGRRLILPEKRFLRDDSYYLPYLTFRDFGEWFDSFGNLLAVLSGVAGKERAEAVLPLIKKYRLAWPYPIRSLYPPISPGQKDWRYYYRFGDLNLPHRYHNGGIWPFLGGFYVAALVRMKRRREAKKALSDLALLNKQGKDRPWEFTEWAQGENGRPMGMAGQAWSAGMYVYAYEAVRREKPPFF